MNILNNKIKKVIRDIKINKPNIKKLKNRDFSVISSNCNGGIILNDLKQKFNSPTVNLFFNAVDYLKFLENMDYYLEQELKPVKNTEETYPVGRIDDIIIHFMHYKNFESAKEKWNERLKRLNKDNLFIIMTDRDGCTYELIERFDKLPFINKVIFTHKEYKNIRSSFYIEGFENEGQVGELSKYKSKFSFNRYYDQFDYVEWFNGVNNNLKRNM